LNVLAGKPHKHDIFTSCGGLRALVAQELLAPLLARVLYLGCTVWNIGNYNPCGLNRIFRHIFKTGNLKFSSKINIL